MFGRLAGVGPARFASKSPEALTDVWTVAYLPGPAVGLGIHSIDHTGRDGLNVWGAAPEGCAGRKRSVRLECKRTIKVALSPKSGSETLYLFVYVVPLKTCGKLAPPCGK